MAISKLATNSQIVLTDGDPLAINLLQQNLNHSSNYIDKQTVQSTLLLWSNSINQNHPFCDWCRHQWSSKQEDDYTTETGFDVIMAGDVLYKAELPPLFFATVKALLVSNGVLYLCHVPRATVTHAIVRNAAISAGFKVEEIDIKTSVTPDLLEGCVMEDVERARVYRMVLKQ
jgi:predicted nicotinamide N-methyase